MNWWSWASQDHQFTIFFFYKKPKQITSCITPSESSRHKFFFSLVHMARLTQLSLSCSVKLAAILQLSQYCTFDGDSISTVITEPGQPVISSSPRLGIILPMMYLKRTVFSHYIRHIADNEQSNPASTDTLLFMCFNHPI